MTRRHGDTQNNRRGDDIAASPRYRVAVSQICSACGAEAKRELSKFCRVCGKHLIEDYQPLDRLRASYRLQGKSFQFEDAKT